MECPDKWVLLKINRSTEPLYKILGGWSGGYLGNDCWRLNSGITSVETQNDYHDVSGYSGSVYRCHKQSYGLTMTTAGIYEQLKERFADEIEMVDEDEVVEIFDGLVASKE